ncbi:hypothetical protein [Streptomyces chattanoogensis]|uniref:Uncharacterized protein n=1 Tax=Streptomyces chattanoogensis TaxID=66876 RepID=A0A0N0GXL7_9ACTN|nr:hypothetical protein [Streptomyces chattanoogensis]KPC61161.1 hypothetical protein ADL29_25620 [Streptomyces chattanoogensis]
MAGGVTPGPFTLLPGYWCERFVYSSLYTEVPVSWAVMTTTSAVPAVRCINADARRMAFGLPERERLRALDRMGRQKPLGAMAALHRGEPCGLGLKLGGAWVEWSARPVLFLPLAGRTQPTCPRTDELREGFGAPLTMAADDCS